MPWDFTESSSVQQQQRKERPDNFPQQIPAEPLHIMNCNQMTVNLRTGEEKKKEGGGWKGKKRKENAAVLHHFRRI